LRIHPVGALLMPGSRAGPFRTLPAPGRQTSAGRGSPSNSCNTATWVRITSPRRCSHTSGRPSSRSNGSTTWQRSSCRHVTRQRRSRGHRLRRSRGPWPLILPGNSDGHLVDPCRATPRRGYEPRHRQQTGARGFANSPSAAVPNHTLVGLGPWSRVPLLRRYCTLTPALSQR